MSADHNRESNSALSESGSNDRLRRFMQFFLWNIAGSLVISVPLFFVAPPILAYSFLGLMIFMSAVVAGYFAVLRVEV